MHQMQKKKDTGRARRQTDQGGWVGLSPELGATRNVSAHRQKNVSRVKVGKTPKRSLPLRRYDCAGTSLDRPKVISERNSFGLPWPDRHPDYIG